MSSRITQIDREQSEWILINLQFAGIGILVSVLNMVLQQAERRTSANPDFSRGDHRAADGDSVVPKIIHEVRSVFGYFSFASEFQVEGFKSGVRVDCRISALIMEVEGDLL